MTCVPVCPYSLLTISKTSIFDLKWSHISLHKTVAAAQEHIAWMNSKIGQTLVKIWKRLMYE